MCAVAVHPPDPLLRGWRNWRTLLSGRRWLWAGGGDVKLYPPESAVQAYAVRAGDENEFRGPVTAGVITGDTVGGVGGVGDVRGDAGGAVDGECGGAAAGEDRVVLRVVVDAAGSGDVEWY